MNIRPIAFSSATNGDEDIYLMDSDGKILRRCTTIRYPGITNRTPEWSPDGRFIAFQSNQDGQRDLYILELSSNLIRRLIKSPNAGASMHPSWSPNGDKIIFVSDRGNGTKLFVIDSDGSNERPFVPRMHSDRQFWNPDWTPDGKRISYVVRGNENENDTLWTSALDGLDSRQLSPKELSVFEYDISPKRPKAVGDTKFPAALVVFTV